MDDVRTRRGRMVALLLGGGGVATLLVPLALAWLRDRVRWFCDLAVDGSGLPPTWVCADGIGYILPLALHGTTIVVATLLALVAVAAASARRRTRRLVATALLVVAAAPPAVLLWWARPRYGDNEGPWLAWALPGALLLAAALGCAALAIWRRGAARAPMIVAVACAIAAAAASLGGLAACAAFIVGSGLAAAALGAGVPSDASSQPDDADQEGRRRSVRSGRSTKPAER